MMTIDVRVTPYERENLKALATVTLGSDVRLNGIRIMENKEGKLFASYPAYQTKAGEYEQYFHPITAEFNKQMNDAIMNVYDADNHRFTSAGDAVNPEVAVRATPLEQDKMRGLASVVLDDSFVVNSVRIMRGDHGLFAAMPSYKNKDGAYQDYVELKGDTKTAVRDKAIAALKSAKAEKAIDKEKVAEKTVEKAVKKSARSKKSENAAKKTEQQVKAEAPVK